MVLPSPVALVLLEPVAQDQNLMPSRVAHHTKDMLRDCDLTSAGCAAVFHGPLGACRFPSPAPTISTSIGSPEARQGLEFGERKPQPRVSP